MIYKQFKDKKLSALGLGMMRLPVKDGSDSQIDEAAAAELIDYAINNGVNYYDTAWGYHGGNSELVAGKLLSKYPREKYYLASKFPGYDLKNMPKVKEIFEKQLEKCKVDYFDFYLFHNVCELNINEYLDKTYGIYEYLTEQKKKGRIKHLGFSAHGDIPVMERFFDAYGDVCEFCQIQLNWLDWKFQRADEKVDLINRHGIPVWVMEPVRGGKLASFPLKYADELKKLRPEEDAAELAFRFIQSVPNVGVTLSGMSNMEQLKSNIKTFSEQKPLNKDEFNALINVAYKMTGVKSLPCTACRYCISHCPRGINIPEIIRLYNEHVVSEGGFISSMGISVIQEDKRPSACVGCRSCEKVCPQQLKISDMMKEYSELIKKNAF